MLKAVKSIQPTLKNRKSSMSYSLWLKPKGELGEQLQREINYLAKKNKSPSFQPHVTLVPTIVLPEDKCVELSQEIAKKLKRYYVTFKEVAKGTFYYQCVFLLCHKEDKTMEACTISRQILGLEPTAYMPHLSLIYAHLTEEQKDAVLAEEVKRLYGENSDYTTLLTDTGFWVDSISLWYTPADESLESWKEIQTFDLQGDK